VQAVGYPFSLHKTGELNEVIENFKWEDWIDPEKKITKTHKRSDTRLKNYPYRSKPVE
jgi:hypothetical protein